MSSQVFAGDTSGSITIQAPAVAGTNILTLPTNTGTLMVSSANTILNAGYAPILPMSSGLIPGELFYRLETAYTGTATTSAQSFLGVGVTLSGSTIYQFEAVFAISKSSSTTAHNLNLVFGGTATLNNIEYAVIKQAGAATSFTDIANSGAFIIYSQSAAATTVAVNTGGLSNYFQTITIKGTVSINAGGTFIPQYQTTASVGPYTTAVGSYFKLSPLGVAGANTSIGTWA